MPKQTFPTLIDALTFIRGASPAGDPRTEQFMAGLECQLESIIDPMWRRELLAVLWQTLLVTGYLITNDRPNAMDIGDAQETVHKLLHQADKFYQQQRAKTKV